MDRKTGIQKAILLAAVLLFILLPLTIVEDPYFLHVLITMGFSLIMAVSLRQILMIGQLSFGHIFFMAVGAYTCALMLKAGFSFWVCLPAAGLLSGILGLVVGLPTLRLRGAYFAILTMCYGAATVPLIGSLGFLGRWTGLGDIPHPTIPFLAGSRQIADKTQYYFLILGLVFVTLAIFYRLDKSNFGAECRAIAQNASLSESVGIRVTRVQVTAFSIACFFAGIGGAFFAPYMRILAPEAFSIWHGADFLVFTVIGGVGHVLGPLVGTMVIGMLNEFLRGYPEIQTIIYALALISAVFFIPGGLISLRFLIPQWIKGGAPSE